MFWVHLRRMCILLLLDTIFCVYLLQLSQVLFKSIVSLLIFCLDDLSLWPHGLYSPWNSPGQNTGVGSLSLLQGIFPTQGSNPGLLDCRRILYQLSHLGSPWLYKDEYKKCIFLYEMQSKNLKNKHSYCPKEFYIFGFQGPISTPQDNRKLFIAATF